MAFQLRGKFSPFSLFQKKTPTHTLLLFPFNMRVYMNKCALLLFPANFPAGRKLLFSPFLLPRHAPSEGKGKENFSFFRAGGKLQPFVSHFSPPPPFSITSISGGNTRERKRGGKGRREEKGPLSIGRRGKISRKKTYSAAIGFAEKFSREGGEIVRAEEIALARKGAKIVFFAYMYTYYVWEKIGAARNVLTRFSPEYKKVKRKIVQVAEAEESSIKPPPPGKKGKKKRRCNLFPPRKEKGKSATYRSSNVFCSSFIRKTSPLLFRLFLFLPFSLPPPYPRA